MSPSDHSDNSWQKVRRGKQKNRPTPQVSSQGRGLQSTQPPSQVAASGQSNSIAQPVLQAAPNGRVQQNTVNHPASAPRKKKEDIPYEIKNAREWDPKRRLQVDSSSEDSDMDDDYDFEDGAHPFNYEDVNGKTTEDGPQSAFPQGSASNTRPYNKLPSHPRAYANGNALGPRRVKPRARFIFKRDNLARAAFRKRMEPSGRFMLPKDCPDIEPNQKRMYDLFDEMGVRLGSFIRPPQHVKDRVLLLWGNARQIQDTKDEIKRWLDNRLRTDFAQKPMAKDKFARETSSIGDQYHRLMKKMQKEAKILEFQQTPAEGRIFSYTGTFLWPVDEVRPEDILGPNLEALDPVRFQHHCHIVFDDKLSSFRIFSDKEDAIKSTMNRLVGTMKEYVAKSARSDKAILIEPPTSSALRKDIKVLPVSLNNSETVKSMIPVLTGSTLNSEGRNEWLVKSSALTMGNTRRMELSLRKCIAKLPHYRGLARMRVQFGTFALKVYRWKEGADSTPFEDFMESMSEPGTKGIMIRDLQIKKDATTIMAKVKKATDLLLPMDSYSTSLEDVLPSFSATFEFKNPDSPPLNFTLEMSSSPAAPTVYEKVQELWTRADRRDNAVPLEIFMARLDSGASWKLQVSAENSMDLSRINPRMADFAESVQLSKIPRTRTELTGQKVFTWKKDLPGIMQPSAFQQKTALKYRLAHQPEWEFEIARYDNYGNPKSDSVPVETNWGATLYNTNWDSILTANTTLGIGEAPAWNPRLETFFPSRSDPADIEGIEGIDPGVTDFLKVVEVVSKLMDSIKKELPHLRV